MKCSKLFAEILCIFAFTVCPVAANAAQVFYLGAGEGTGTEQNPSYPLKQRVKDLVDFQTVDRPITERSGQISGTLMQELDWNNVSGNKSKSFLRNGVDYISEANISAVEKLKGDYKFEGQLSLRKTDNNRIEPRRDVRMKQYDMKVLNNDYLYEFGQFYGDYSNFVMSSSLEGLNTVLYPTPAQKYSFVAAKSQGPDTAADVFQRNVFGFQARHGFFEGSDSISKFDLGFQVASTQDDSSTIDRTGSTNDLNNTVYGIDGEIALPRVFSTGFEWAHSHYVDDEDISTGQVKNEANAFRVQPKLDLGRTAVRYLFYYVQPEFNTATGSAANDKMQHQVNLDFKMTDLATLNLTNNFYWDHLSGSTKTKRTYNQENQLALNWKPFITRTDFMLRPYLGHIDRYSDDPGTSVETRTRTAGFSVNASLDQKTTCGFNYEYRGYADDATPGNSDYINRIGVNFGKETQFFAKRLFYSLGPSLDFRRTKTDNNFDVGSVLSASGQWDSSKASVTRFGLNVQNTNSARANSDFMNTQDYLEYDYKMAEKRDTHVIFRLENNRFDHNDGIQEYREYRVIMKLMTRF